jgi:phospholipid/cholesterol/gamma-HCH transport system substrate-binding protein
MSKQASPTLIGAFVVGAIALVVIGLLVFGSGRFFSERVVRVAIFPGSVQGLRVGASVNFRGVAVGEVTSIRVLYDDKDGSLLIPVLIELLPDRVTVIDQGGAERPDRNELDDLIEHGLRAQLQVDSLVTGLLSVDLDFYPESPAETIAIHNPEFADLPQIPTIPSRMEALEQSLTTVMQDVPGLLSDVRTLLGEVTSGKTAGTFAKILDDVQVFTHGLDRATPAIQSLVAQAERSAASVERLADNADQTLTANREAIDATVADLQSTAVAVRRMADQINNLAAENRQGLRDFTESGLYEITGLAQDAQRMVNQITRVAEQLERDPGRFLFGDRGQGVRAQ